MVQPGHFADKQKQLPLEAKVLELGVYGDVPFTAILGRLPAERPGRQDFDWFEEAPPVYGGNVTGIFKNIAMTSAYGAGDDLTAGTAVHAQVPVATAEQLRPGFQVILRANGDSLNDVTAKVTGVVKNGASSRVDLALLEDDGSGPSDLSECDYLMVVGDINAPGAEIPQSLSFQPQRFTSYTQIMRTSLKISRTAMQTRLRTEQAYKRLKAKRGLDHSRLQERTLLFGVPGLDWNADLDEYEYRTEGLFWAVRNRAPDNVSNFVTVTDSAFAGKTWGQAGKDWWEAMLFKAGLKGSLSDKLCVGGGGALLGLQRMAEANSQMNLSPGAKKFGIAVTSFMTTRGSLSVYEHPMFNEITSLNNTLCVVDVKHVKKYDMQPTRYYSDPNNPFMSGNKGSSPHRIDGIAEEYLTERGFAIQGAETHMILEGVGLDNTVT